jgi:N-acetylglucosaminyl-diphospho-decaprenol L-rhamnosyltransferase
MSNPDIAVSVVVVSWNTRELLARCLEALAEGEVSSPTCEAFVVDNASSDGSAEMVPQRFPAVHLIANRANVGFARANNQALRESTGRYLLLLNPDTEVRPGAVASLVRFMDQHSRVGAAGARLLNPDGTLEPSCHPAPTLSREVWRLFHLDLLWPYAAYPISEWDLEHPQRVDVIQGACMMVRREAIDQVGLLDEDFFIYSEEVDLCRRLRQSGWDVYWVPQATVMHHGGQSTRQVASSMFLRLHQAKVHYFRKHQGWLGAQAYKLILFAAAGARLLVSPLAWLENPSNRQRHRTLAGHYYRLLRALPRL